MLGVESVLAPTTCCQLSTTSFSTVQSDGMSVAQKESTTTRLSGRITSNEVDNLEQMTEYAATAPRLDCSVRFDVQERLHIGAGTVVCTSQSVPCGLSRGIGQSPKCDGRRCNGIVVSLHLHRLQDSIWFVRTLGIDDLFRMERSEMVSFRPDHQIPIDVGTQMHLFSSRRTSFFILSPTFVAQN